MSIDIVAQLVALENRVQELKSIDSPGNYTDGGVLFGNTSGKATTDADLIWDNTAKKLTINGGNTTSTNTLVIDVTTTETDASTARTGITLEAIYNPGSTQLTGGKFGTIAIAAVDGTGGASSVGALVGLRVDSRYRQSSGTFSGIVYGVDAVLRHSGAGTLTTAYGVRSVPALSSTGSLTNWYGVLVESPSITSSGGITTAYGIRINRQKLASGVTTGYGVYQLDSNDLNFLAGAIDMPEQSAPSAPATNTGRLFVRDNGAGKTQLCIIFNTGAVQVIATQP